MLVVVHFVLCWTPGLGNQPQQVRTEALDMGRQPGSLYRPFWRVYIGLTRSGVAPLVLCCCSFVNGRVDAL